MFYTMFFTSKTKCFYFKSECVVLVVKRLKKTGSWCCDSNCSNFVTMLKSFITNVLKCKALLKTKFICAFVTMHSLVMSPFSRDFIKTDIN